MTIRNRLARIERRMAEHDACSACAATRYVRIEPDKIGDPEAVAAALRCQRCGHDRRGAKVYRLSEDEVEAV